MNPKDFINCCLLYVQPHWSFICLRQAFSSFLDPRARQQLTNTLDQEVSRLRQLTFAESSRRTYSCQLLLYLKFCSSLNISPVPISQHDLGRYIAFISSKLSFSSVRQYLNAVRLLHLEGGYANPLLDNWYISSILKGMRRLKGDASRQKLPITCQILQRILTVLDFDKPFDLCFWAACLVGFFSFFVNLTCLFLRWISLTHVSISVAQMLSLALQEQFSVSDGLKLSNFISVFCIYHYLALCIPLFAPQVPSCYV